MPAHRKSKKDNYLKHIHEYRLQRIRSEVFVDPKDKTKVKIKTTQYLRCVNRSSPCPEPDRTVTTETNG